MAPRKLLTRSRATPTTGARRARRLGTMCVYSFIGTIGQLIERVTIHAHSCRGGSYSAVERLLELDGAHGLRVLVPLLPPVVRRGDASLLVIFSIHHNVS